MTNLLPGPDRRLGFGFHFQFASGLFEELTNEKISHDLHASTLHARTLAGHSHALPAMASRGDVGLTLVGVCVEGAWTLCWHWAGWADCGPTLGRL